MQRQFTSWPQPLVLILSYPQTSTLPERLLTVQNDARSFDFDDYDETCIAGILDALIKARNYSATNIKQETLLNAVRSATARGMGTESPNAQLAVKLLNDAIQRQTERVWVKDTMSWEGLTTLCDDDFAQEQKDAQVGSANAVVSCRAQKNISENHLKVVGRGYGIVGRLLESVDAQGWTARDQFLVDLGKQ